jgi:CRISPR/Cas system-associated protein Cas7 (RAMP superfamily)
MTENELFEIWEAAKKGNTYSRKPLPAEYVKEAENYINKVNSTIEKRKTSWSVSYPTALIKEIGK